MKLSRFVPLAALAFPVLVHAVESFDQFKTGALPAPWRFGITGDGSANWQVVAADEAASKPQALKFAGGAAYLWAVKSDVRIGDGFVAVKGRALSGKVDQSIGVIWRFIDEKNYYVVRSNSLEGNVVAYKFENGPRTMLAVKDKPAGTKGANAPVPAGEWHTLRADFKGSLFTFTVNGKQLFQVADSTFAQGGAVGLWTKADSETLYDDFQFGGN